MQFRLKRYILGETLPGLLLGVLAFIFVLLMFQMLRLLEFFLIHGVSLTKVFEIVGSMSISFLPTLLPMVSLFAVVLAISRLSQESETVALVSIGVSPLEMLKPLIGLGALLSGLSIFTALELAPNGNRRFEMILHEISQSKITAAVKENAFTESFYNLVIFALGSDSKTGKLEKIFIYDEQNKNTPLSIIAKEGLIFTQANEFKSSLWLKLQRGNIHRQDDSHTKIKFAEYEVKLIDSQQIKSEIEKSQNSWTIRDLIDRLKSPDQSRLARIELNKRIAIGFACLLLVIFGFTLSYSINRRVKSNGFVLSLIVIVSYWLLIVSFENVSLSGYLVPELGLWIPNIIFSLIGVRRLKNILN
jgi:lipopolysaccharide export system permease protein